jgi:hypothetical protein
MPLTDKTLLEEEEEEGPPQKQIKKKTPIFKMESRDGLGPAEQQKHEFGAQWKA